ncbi:MAG: bifunctional DNA-formamidopyrimidine glycosylase/DNA-(apurinic or apyrimidinic site) lyase [Actinobacteria bacterium]|nr:bifunctional DNA-formamidopyrimidine glycosylase/DNA-(apurinic or apyrimidinic site) lyase [Actinomycetota bacterium]MDQ3532145.1 bifunctional DNA-formamidopyrimidine glycosylase/DNA-(apurinic or apyrimidinic site) lyase [Actinomycetota bacterium]
MPELPEVESVRRQLDPELSGRRVLDVWVDPHPMVPRQFQRVEELRGRKISFVGRRGKFLISPLDRGLELVMHLGMTGVFRFDVSDPYTRASLTLDNGRRLIFKDVRRFGRIAVVDAGRYDTIPTLVHLGPEPLSQEFDPALFSLDLTRTNAPVKPFLLSQRPVAGVGNIYADEALWVACIHPGSRRVGPKRAQLLHTAIREVLSAAIDREGTSFSDYRMVNGASGRNASFLFAYGRGGEPCPRCSNPLRKIVLGGRGTTYCPRCQRY